LSYRTFALTGAFVCAVVAVWSFTHPHQRASPQPLAPRPVATPRPTRAAPAPVRNAPARPAFGFELDHTRRLDVKVWTFNHQLSCRDSTQHRLDFWVCESVSSHALGLEGQPDLRYLSFGFAPDDTLISVTLIRDGLGGSDLVALLEQERLRLADGLGSPTAVHGADTAAALDAGGVLKVEYRYSDYLAILRAVGHAHRPGELSEYFESSRALSLFFHH
jgi:hypothetical protein